MNINTLLQDPALIDNLSAEQKTDVYFQLVKMKETLNNKLSEYKAQKELLEKQKEELQNELVKVAGVSDLTSLSDYLQDLQNEFDVSLKNECAAINEIMKKLNM